MKEKAVVIYGMRFLLVLVALGLLSWLLMNFVASITQPSSYVDHSKNRYEDDAKE